MGGVIAAFFGRQTVFALNALSFIVSGLLIQRMKFEEPHLRDLAPFRVRDLFDFRPIAEGFRYVRSNSRLAATMLVKAGLGLIGTNWVILPILGRESFPVQLAGLTGDQSATLGMSLLLGARGVGAILGPLVAGYWARSSQERMRPAIVVGFLMASAGYLLLSVVNNTWMAGFSVALAHAGTSITWVFSTTLLQLNTEDKFRGRVFSVEFGFSVAMMAVMSSTAGVLIDQGISPFGLAAVTGAVMLIPAFVWLFALRLWRE